MAGELAAEWIKIPDGNGNLQKVWVRDSTARRDVAQLQTDLAQLQTDVGGLVIPDPSDAAPQMDGTAAAGSSADYSRADHVHPTDTSRQAALSQAQLDAANSGITAAKVAAYDAIQVPTKTSDLTNDSGFITSSKFAVITCTVGSAAGYGGYTDLPTGFTFANTIILSVQVPDGSGERAGDGLYSTSNMRLFAEISTSGCRIYCNSSRYYNASVKVALMRNDI